MNPFPIDYAFRPRLRSRLTLPRLTLDRNPWSSGVEVFHLSFRYSYRHPPFRHLQGVSRLPLHRHTECSPTPYTSLNVYSRDFGVGLQPRCIVGARLLDQ